MLLTGQTVLIAGAGPGLGREIALAAAREGANVVLGARREENLRTIAEEVDADGKRVAYAVTDIGDTAAIQALVDLADARFGALHAVVNVAAYDSLLGGLEATTEQQWRDVFDVNVFGTMNVIRAALPLLKREGGAVVLIGTQATVKPTFGLLQTAYAASKGALISAMYNLAVELGPHRIRVNTVAPGWMMGPPVEGYIAWQSFERKVSPEEVRADLESRMALPSLASDGDVAEAVVFLASDSARSITGQTLLVNAGEFMR